MAGSERSSMEAGWRTPLDMETTPVVDSTVTNCCPDFAYLFRCDRGRGG